MQDQGNKACKPLSRRSFLASTTAALTAVPFINLGRYRAFAASDTEYSERAISLANKSLVGDIWVS